VNKAPLLDLIGFDPKSSSAKLNRITGLLIYARLMDQGLSFYDYQLDREVRLFSFASNFTLAKPRFHIRSLP
jgi:hypothetical protein